MTGLAETVLDACTSIFDMMAIPKKSQKTFLSAFKTISAVSLGAAGLTVVNFYLSVWLAPQREPARVFLLLAVICVAELIVYMIYRDRDNNPRVRRSGNGKKKRGGRR
jgi:hypothetical protein